MTNIIFGKEQSVQIKGVAIIMLILHHLFLFPSDNPWFTGLFLTHSGNVEFFFSAVGKLCISMFFFVSGYGLWVVSQNDTNLWRSTFRRLKDIYIIYIVSVAATVLLFLITDKTLVLLSWKHALATFLGIDVSINGSWWFFVIYVELLLLLPFAVIVVRKYSCIPLILTSFLAYMVSAESGLPWISDFLETQGLGFLFFKFYWIKLFWFNQFYFFIGFCLASSGIFERCLQFSVKFLRTLIARVVSAVFLITAILLTRYYLLDLFALLGSDAKINMDIFQYTLLSTRADFVLGPLLIFALALLFYQHSLPVLSLIGKHSAAIWLIHGSVIAVLMHQLKQYHLWSPVIFVFILSVCILYSLVYSICYRYIENTAAGKVLF